MGFTIPNRASTVKATEPVIQYFVKNGMFRYQSPISDIVTVFGALCLQNKHNNRNLTVNLH